MLGVLGELAAPVTCAGCGRRTVALCSGCRAELGRLARGTSLPVRPDPTPPGMPRTWALAPYDAVLRRVIVTHKDEGRVALCSELARLWRVALAGALVADPVLAGAVADHRLLVVPVPSSAASIRDRGRDPWRAVVSSGIGDDPRLSARCALQVRRRVRDQAGLGAAHRAANLRGAMTTRSGLDVAGATCLVTDDVVTTGATLVEATRALRAAGAESVRAVVIAATQRHRATQMTSR